MNEQEQKGPANGLADEVNRRLAKVDRKLGDINETVVGVREEVEGIGEALKAYYAAEAARRKEKEANAKR